jgi:hypothetical protein
MKKLLGVVTGLLLAGVIAHAQNPQTQQAPIIPENAKYANGVAPGYYPTQQAVGGQSAATGLNINVGPGTANCGGTIVSYAGGQFTMTASTVNYLYLNTSASCAPAAKTTSYTSSDIPIGMVTAGSSTLTSIVDDRTIFNLPGSSSGSVTQILAGPGIAISPSGGTGNVTVSSNGIGDQIQEFGPFTAQCGTSNGYALMNSAAVATLPAYTEKCLIPFSAVGAGTVAPIVSGSTNIFNECPPAGLFSSVHLASPQTLRIWSNGTNWEASCPFGSPVFNVKQSCGASGSGATDDTTAIDSCIAILNATGKGALYFPAGNYLVSSTLTAITAPAAIYGDGSVSTDLTEPISQISCTSATTDCVKVTSEYASLHDLAIVNTASTAPSAGAGLDFCPTASPLFQTFDVDHVTFANNYTGISACVSEDAHITNSRFLGMFHDGILLGNGTASNAGDTLIQGNFFTASGATANASIDFEGSAAARIFGNKQVLGVGGGGGGGSSFNYAVLNGGPSPQSIQLQIENNDFEESLIMPIDLGADCDTATVSGNTLTQYPGDTVGPFVKCVTGGNVTFGVNTFVNATGSTVPEAILITGTLNGSLLMPQNAPAAVSGSGFTTIASGFVGGIYGNVDYSTLISAEGLLTASANTNGVNTLGNYTTDTGIPTTLQLKSYGVFESALSLCVNAAGNCATIAYNYANGTAPDYGTLFTMGHSGQDNLYFLNGAGVPVGAFGETGDGSAIFGTFATTHNWILGAPFGFWDGTYKGLFASPSMSGNDTWTMPDATGTVGVIPTASTGHAFCETTSHTMGHCSSVVASDGTCTCN